MSLVIRLSDDEDATDDINLANPLQAITAFAEIATALGDGRDEEFGQLYAVPYTAEEVVDPQWLGAVRIQAKAALAEVGDKIGKHARWILETLAGGPPVTEQYAEALKLAGKILREGYP